MSSKNPVEAPDPIPRGNDAATPSAGAVEAFCQYLRELEVDPEADWSALLDAHPEHAQHLSSLLEQYERISAILERLQPAASFSARLRAHYGDGIDPGVSLSSDGPRRQGLAQDESSKRSTGKVLSRLSAQTPNLSRYQQRQEIARGGMGAIQEVWDTELRRTLAMKVVLGGIAAPGSSQSSEDTAERRLSRFLHEAQITGQLDHPGIVPVHDIGMDEDGRVFFTMQLIDGHDLRKVFEFARLERHDWDTRRVISVLVRVCESMAYAHSKAVIHRDLKPANIMVGAFGEAYVMDWGLAKVLGDAGVSEGDSTPLREKTSKVHTDRSDGDSESDGSSLKTLDGDIVGTPAYMAPEQALGKLGEVGLHSDVYAMGAMLYHLLSGHAPYEPLGEKVPAHTILDAVRKAPPWPLRQVQPEVDGELAAICEKAMAREPSLRYESMMALGEDLRAWVEGRGVGAYTTGVWYETRKWMARNMATTMALGAIAFLLLASVILFAYWQQSSLSKLQAETSAKEQALSAAEDARSEADGKAEEARESEAEMKVERDRADREAKEALTQKQIAEEGARQLGIQKAIAQEQQKRSASIAYRSSINAAAFSLRLDELEAVRRNLDACDMGMRGWEWNHIDLASDPSVGEPRVQERGVTDLAVGEDGATLLTYGFGLRPRLWDVPQRRMLDIELPGPTFFNITAQTQLERWRCALAPGGGFAAVSNPIDNSVLMLNTATGAVMYASQEHDAAVTGVSFSPDGSLTATCSEDGTAILFDTVTARLVKRLDFGAGALFAIAFSPNGSRLATGGADGNARVWGVESEEPVMLLSGHHTADVVSVDWTDEGDRLASASLDGSMAVWSVSDGAMTSVMHGHRGEVYDLVFGRGGEELFSAGEDRTVRMWATNTGKQLRVFNGHEDHVRGLVRLGDSDSIVSCSKDGTLRFWDARWDPALTRIHLPGEGDCTELAFDPAGRRLMANILGGNVAVLDADRGMLERENVAGDLTDSDIGQLSHSALGVARVSGHVAFASPGRITVLSGNTGEVEHVIEGFDTSIARLAISDHGDRIVAGNTRRALYFIDLKTGRQNNVLLGSSLDALAISPDGELAVTAQSDESLTLWDAKSGDSRAHFSAAHSKNITALAFNKDGTLLASASVDETARLWAMPELDLLTPEFAEHGETVTAVAFSPTESRLVTGSAGGSVRVWNLETRELLFQDVGQAGRIEALCFSPNGERLAVASGGNEVQVWESDRGDARYRLRFED
jgi:WD40 repeat protein/serine/threonine protein kinase